MDLHSVKQSSAELIAMLTHATAALTTIQGIEAGFFDWVPANKSITARELSGQMGFEISRVERWLRFALAAGYVTESGSGYTLTTKGALLRRGTPVPDLLGLHHMVSYFAKALHYSREAYQKGMGLDSITKGEISRDYIPRVASHLSMAAVGFFIHSGLSSGHTVLDLGCGDGSVLREAVQACPGISAAGIDMNIHTLEMGKRTNTELGLQDQIELRRGDVTDLSNMKDGAYDWGYAINVFHFLPLLKRDVFLREMMRISRYGVFFNQVIANTLGTYSVDVLLSTLFTDYTGFFTTAEADEIIAKAGARHYTLLPIIQGESRLVVMYTSRNDVPVSRIPGIGEASVGRLEASNIRTAKELLAADCAALANADINLVSVRAAAIKLLFP